MSLQRTMAGFFIILLGVFLILLALSITLLGSSARGFGIIIIGPIPIVLSGGADAITILSLIVIAVLSVLILLALLPFIKAGTRQQ